jgi:hypothetical protein
VTRLSVIIFDEYQKKETVNLKTRVTSNVFSGRNLREKLRKNPVAIVLTSNHSKVDLEKDGAANEEPGTFFYIEIFKRQPTLKSEFSSHFKS